MRVEHIPDRRNAQLHMLFNVCDDSGLIALVDPDAYETYVSSDWTYATIVRRFKSQMRRHRLLIWGTGLELDWNVRVILNGRSRTRCAFREAVGPIASTQGRLLMTSYDSLTMVAQFPDERLPQEHETSQLFNVEPGQYSCTVRQLYDPDTDEAFKRKVHFELLLKPTPAPPPLWRAIPWPPP